VRNDGYWGAKSPWQAVHMVPVTNAGPRLAGLIAGDFDVIENPAARDLPRIKEDKRLTYVVTPSSRVIYLQLDVARDASPLVKDAKGGNPFRDPRVRRAMAIAIDREAICKRIMDGAAHPAAQFLPTGMYGTLADPTPIPFDPAGARKLLAEAGYASGFDVTLSATNDRYINDVQIAQAVAGYLTQVGIRTKVDAMTRAIFFPRRAKKEFSLALGGWGAAEGSSFLRYWAVAPDEKRTRGTSNYGGLDDPQLNVLVNKALMTMDDDARAAILRQAITRLIETGAFIPLHFESSIWAHRADLVVKGRTDQYTLAMSVTPGK
jgi:peptide/nickel transport system substrate-binding protein